MKKEHFHLKSNATIQKQQHFMRPVLLFIYLQNRWDTSLYMLDACYEGFFLWEH